MAERTVTTCDKCNAEIKTFPPQEAEQYINAGVYGVHLHERCFGMLSGFELIKLLGLDDINLVRQNGDSEKFIYSRR